jgi:hypothetical protein
MLKLKNIKSAMFTDKAANILFTNVTVYIKKIVFFGVNINTILKY